MSENVTISLKFFYKLFDFIEKLDTIACPASLKCEYVGILYALMETKQIIERELSGGKLL